MRKAKIVVEKKLWEEDVATSKSTKKKKSRKKITITCIN